MLWLMLGIACVAVDVFITQTLVLLFFGLGALTTAIFSYWVSDFNHQIIIFLASSITWSIALWKPLTARKKKKSFKNIIGQEVVVQNKALAPGERGFGKWSGTSVNIELTANSNVAQPGDRLVITRISGITFFVTNKELNNDL